jgi:hypothetical protein
VYLLYVDESGDPGPKGQGQHFVLSGLIVHETHWAGCFRLIKDLRIALREEFNIRRNQELHANKVIAGRGALWGRRWSIDDRIRVFQLVLEAVSQMSGLRSVNVCINKNSVQFAGGKGFPVLETAWKFLLQRFHNYMEHRKSGSTECGMVIHDAGHEVEVRKLMRKLRVFNPVPSRFGPGSRNVPLVHLIEDPVPRDSYHAQFIQLCDFLAYAVLRQEEPATKYPGLEKVFEIVQPVWLVEGARTDPQGIVRYPKT